MRTSLCSMCKHHYIIRNYFHMGNNNSFICLQLLETLHLSPDVSFVLIK